MPATMMHLLAGHTLLPQGSDDFFLGCILPDCLDYDRALKDRFHLRDVAPEDRFSRLIQFGEELNLDYDFDFGVLCHLHLDYLWDNGPQSDHRKAYTGDLWFRDYRKELACAGSRAAQRMAWSKPLWERLHALDRGSVLKTPVFDSEAMEVFIEFNYYWHTMEVLPESKVFTDALVDSFVSDAEEKFAAFLREYFPSVAKKRLLT